MTDTTTRKAPPELDELQVLIEEARERQHRRRRWLIAVAVVVALISVLVVAQGPGGPPKARQHAPTALPTPSLVAHWTNLSASGAGLPDGAQFTSVVSWRGRLVATGSYYPNRAAIAPGYPPNSPLLVWTSTDGIKWTMTWYAYPNGPSDLGAILVSTPTDLLVFAEGEGGSGEWSSTDAVTFTPVTLPPTMSALGIDAAIWTRSRVVALVKNKYIGSRYYIYGSQGDSIWSSVDGVTWTAAPFPGAPVFSSLTATPTGVRVTGKSSVSGQSETWLSSDGVKWKTGPAGAPPGLYTATDKIIVAENRQTAPVQLWWSRDGSTWTRAHVRGYLFSDLVGPDGTLLTAGPEGFVTSGNPSSALWSSPTGAVWTRVANGAGPNPTALDVTAYFPDSNGLLAEVRVGSITQLEMEFWQVTFSSALP